MTRAPIGPRRALWALLLAWHLLQIWFSPYFLSQDGPLHVYIAWLLERLGEDAPAVIRASFVHNEAFEPNIAVHHVLQLLLGVVPPGVAEKITVSGYLFLLVFGARYAVKAIEPRASFVALLFFPFALGYFVHKGFYNYCLGTAFFLWGFGWWWRHCERPSVVGYLGLALIAGLTTLTHLFALMMLALVIGCARFGRLLLELRRGGWESVRRFGVDAGLTLLAFAPGIWAVLDFFGRYAVTEAGSASRGRLYLAEQLVTLLPLHSFGPDEYLAALPLFLLLLVLSGVRVWNWLRARRLQPADMLLFPLFALVLVYFLNHFSTRDVPIWKRLLPFTIFVGMLWLAARPWGRRAERLILAVALVVSLASGTLRLVRYTEMNEYAREYLAAGEHVDAGSTLLAVHFARPGHEPREWRSVDWVNPFRHLSARIALARDGVDLRSSIISRECYGYFPVVYRAGRDPYALLGMLLEDVPPPIRLADYAASGMPIDYVLAWGLHVAEPGLEGASLRAELERDFELQWRSEHGWAALYRSRR